MPHVPTDAETQVQVIDCFPFNGEPVTALRLAHLAPVVDRFVVTEARHTHAGTRKPELFSETQAELFAPYRDKLTLLILDELPATPDPEWLRRKQRLGHTARMHEPEVWHRENHQRDYPVPLLRELCHGRRSIVLGCDVDEIPRAQVVSKLRGMYDDLHASRRLEMDFYYYDFRWRQQNTWSRAFAVSDRGLAKHPSLEHFRTEVPSTKRVRDAGWHLSFFMSKRDIVRKLESFCHSEQNRSELKAEAHLERCLRTGADLFGNAPMLRSHSTDFPDGWRELQAQLEAQR